VISWPLRTGRRGKEEIKGAGRAIKIQGGKSERMGESTERGVYRTRRMAENPSGTQGENLSSTHREKKKKIENRREEGRRVRGSRQLISLVHSLFVLAKLQRRADAMLADHKKK